MTAFAADPQDSEENGIVDFVLVLDCSGSLNVTDPSHLCATACKMFVDMVPLENARISVIAFGYDGGTQYTLKNMSIDNPLDLKKVYLVSDMVEASAIKDKNALKQQVRTRPRRAVPIRRSARRCSARSIFWRTTALRIRTHVSSC